jgi:hypothetical protein
MPMIELSDEEMQQLTMVLANASGPGVSWMITNTLLTRLQAAAQAQPAAPKRSRGNAHDALQGELDASLPR